MSNLKKSLDLLKSQGKAFKAVSDIAEALEEITSIDQAKSEAEAGLEASRKQLEEFELEAGKRLLQLNQEIDNANYDLEESQRKADQVIEDAKTEASKIRSTATKSAQTKTKNAEQKVQDAIDDLGKLNTTIADRESDLSEIQGKVDKANKELAKIKAKMGF